MKKLFPLFILIPLTMLFIYSCSKVEHYCTTNYILNNSTVDEIKIISYSSINIYDSGLNDTIIIPSKRQKKIKYVTEGFRDPFFLYDNPTGRDSLIITNGKSQVIQRHWKKDELYFRENYNLLSSKRFEETYEYTFTEEYFTEGSHSD